MEWSVIAKGAWEAVNSPAGITVIASVVLWLLNRVYAKRPLWQKYEGAIISGIKFAEKQIPDNSPSAGLARMDQALKYVVRVYETINHRRATDEVKAELESGIGILHAELEAEGALGSKKKEEF